MALLLPEQEDGADAEEVLGRGMSPPHFPITPRGLRGAWTFGSIRPGPLKAEGFLIEAREVPHKGGRTFGYRVSDGRSVLTYIPDHCPTAAGPGPDGWGEYHPAARRWPPARTCSSTTVSWSRARSRPRRRSGTRPPTTRSAWAAGPGPGGCCWPTTSRTAPTRPWTSWASGSPAAGPAAGGHRGRRRHHLPALTLVRGVLPLVPAGQLLQCVPVELAGVHRRHPAGGHRDQRRGPGTAFQQSPFAQQRARAVLGQPSPSRSTRITPSSTQVDLGAGLALADQGRRRP